MLIRCYWVASGVLKECFRDVTEMLHGCFRIVPEVVDHLSNVKCVKLHNNENAPFDIIIIALLHDLTRVDVFSKHKSFPVIMS